MWLAVAAGSVAVLLIAAQRRRRANRLDARARASRTAVPFHGAAGVEPPRPAAASSREASRPGQASETARARAAAARGSSPGPRPFVTDASQAALEPPLPSVQRAALAARLGQPAELRRLALELASTGQEAEAGLLDNYALLLERSRVNRARVTAEVTRMLRAAAADRKSTRRPSRSARAEVSPPPSPPTPLPEGARERSGHARANADAAREPSAAERSAHERRSSAPPPAVAAPLPSAAARAPARPRALVPMPPYPVNVWRRASR